ncbi:MFS transporter [Paenibacillus aestuarii]|uniref:MFS transporter n=1 Tax=Paenibacillus aestuarii TaxID=516965 RepID=A0ABW0K8J5_9BACL|nr:MFS transporter [Paenibacillus aestuarii]
MEPVWKRNLYILWVGLFFNHLAYTLSVPFFPIFLEHDLGVKAGVEAWAGVSISLSFLISGLCAPFWGSIADRYGKKPMLIRSGIGLGLAHLANYLVHDPYSFILVRVFQGLMAGFSPLSVAFVGSNTPDKHVGSALGIISTATAAGSILGPLAGGLCSHWFGLRECFIVSGLITLMSAVIIIFGVKEVHERQTGPRERMWRDLKQAVAKPGILPMYALLFIVSTSVTVLEPLLALYVVQLGGSADSATLSSGIVFSAVGVATVIMGPYWGKIGGKIGYEKTLFIGLIGGALGNLLQLVFHDLVGFGVLRFSYGLFFAAVFPAMNALIVQYADAEYRSKAISLSQSFSQFGIVAGPLLGGMLGGWLGIHSLFMLTGVTLFAAGWYIRLRHAKRSEPAFERPL